jgi:hypothetical protein
MARVACRYQARYPADLVVVDMRPSSGTPSRRPRAPPPGRLSPSRRSGPARRGRRPRPTGRSSAAAASRPATRPQRTPPAARSSSAPSRQQPQQVRPPPPPHMRVAEAPRDLHEHLVEPLRPRGMPVPGTTTRIIHDPKHAATLADGKPPITQPRRPGNRSLV